MFSDLSVLKREKRTFVIAPSGRIPKDLFDGGSAPITPPGSLRSRPSVATSPPNNQLSDVQEGNMPPSTFASLIPPTSFRRRAPPAIKRGCLGSQGAYRPPEPAMIFADFIPRNPLTRTGSLRPVPPCRFTLVNRLPPPPARSRCYRCHDFADFIPAICQFAMISAISCPQAVGNCVLT